ncbi:hypothetical protein [Patulibacter minatonensis]|uniref:hypothetical protein n=1 Tax=Patulibacter minatonensis TaxID=298163 RepID=UPI00047B9520|nr:hypothetical protein [Patulibacter minatonensis]
MRRNGERLRVGDRVHLPHREVHGVVVEDLGRQVARMFRDGVLEVHEVARFCVRLDCGRRVVVNDRAGQVVRVPQPRPLGTPAPAR